LPQLRFVHGRVALVQAGYNTPKPGRFFYQPQATYLIEKVIPSALGDFIKYVHNADPTPQLPSFAGPAATGCKAGRASGMIIYQLFKLVLALFN
jgi:hypothetical protein